MNCEEIKIIPRIPPKNHLNNEIKMVVKELYAKQTSLFETFLEEYCEVNGISEDKLKQDFQLSVRPMDFSMAVESIGTPKVTLLGLKYHFEFLPENSHYRLSGKFIQQREKYPRTMALIDSLNGKVEFDGGDSDTSSGE